MNNDVWKYYIQTTLTEDGCGTLTIRNGFLRMIIQWERTIDITDALSETSKDILKTLNPGTYAPSFIKKLGWKVYEDILEHPPMLLLKERRELIRRHYPQIPT